MDRAIGISVVPDCLRIVRIYSQIICPKSGELIKYRRDESLTEKKLGDVLKQMDLIVQAIKVPDVER